MNKKIFFTLLLTLLFSAASLYSQHALELAVYGNGGINFSFPNVYNAEYLRKNAFTNYPITNIDANYQNGVGFNISGALQVGYYMEFYRELSGLSFLMDIGGSYTKTDYSVIFQNKPGTSGSSTPKISDKIIHQNSYITGNIGFLFKMHFFKNFSFGIGGGLKLSFLEDNILLSQSVSGETPTEMTYLQPPITIANPYLKITAEYNIFFVNDWSVRIGVLGDVDMGYLMMPKGMTNAKTPIITVGAFIGAGHLIRFEQD